HQRRQAGTAGARAARQPALSRTAPPAPLTLPRPHRKLAAVRRARRGNQRKPRRKPWNVRIAAIRTSPAPAPAYNAAPTRPPPSPQHTPHPAQAGRTVPNHLVWAIRATICCCLPTGIVSIIYAARVDGKVQAGDLAGARQSSDNAKLWAWISFGLGLVGGAAY